STGLGAALANWGRGFLKDEPLLSDLPSNRPSNLLSERGASCLARSKPRSCLPPDGFLPFPFGAFTRNSNHHDWGLGRINRAGVKGENDVQSRSNHENPEVLPPGLRIEGVSGVGDRYIAFFSGGAPFKQARSFLLVHPLLAAVLALC